MSDQDPSVRVVTVGPIERVLPANGIVAARMARATPGDKLLRVKILAADLALHVAALRARGRS